MKLGIDLESGIDSRTFFWPPSLPASPPSTSMASEAIVVEVRGMVSLCCRGIRLLINLEVWLIAEHSEARARLKLAYGIGPHFSLASELWESQP